MGTIRKTLKVGIASPEYIRKRTIAIAKGTHKPQRGEPKVWFTSLQSLANVLTADNLSLLKAIEEAHPQSITDLSKYVGRQQPNVSRTLKSMEKYGFVKLTKTKSNRGKDRIVPRATSEKIEVAII